MNNDLDREAPEADRVDPAATPDQSRREALAKLSKLAGYTAPVILTLLVARNARAESPPDPP